MTDVEIAPRAWQAAGVYPDRLKPVHSLSPDLLACWSEHGEPMLVISLPRTQNPRPKVIQTENIDLSWRTHSNRENLVLRLKAKHLCEQFFLVSEHIATALLGKKGPDLIAGFVNELAEWSEFLHPKRSGLKNSDKIGLAAELSVLQQDLLIILPAAEALRMWMGPSGSPTDVNGPGLRLEIKGTTENKKNRLRISSLHQLDTGNISTAIAQIVLDVVSGTGKSLSRQIDEIKSSLGNEPFLISSFTKKISGLTSKAKDGELEEFIFERVSLRYWEVKSDFPRLTPANIDNAIVTASYQIDTNQINEFLGTEHLHDYLRRHASNNF